MFDRIAKKVYNKRTDKIMIRRDDMIQIRPVSDLRNKFSDIEKAVSEENRYI